MRSCQHVKDEYLKSGMTKQHYNSSALVADTTLMCNPRLNKFYVFEHITHGLHECAGYTV